MQYLVVKTTDPTAIQSFLKFRLNIADYPRKPGQAYYEPRNDHEAIKR